MRKFSSLLFLGAAVGLAAAPAGMAATQGILPEFVGFPPVAVLSVSPASGQAPIEVRADASLSYDIDGSPIQYYQFDFGDGSEQAPVTTNPIAYHWYRRSGTFTITAYVIDIFWWESSATAQVTVSLPPGDFPPLAALSVEPSTGVAPLTVTADASSSSDTDQTPIASYLFDFGDYSKKIGPSPEPTAQHRYGTPGTYIVTVTETDSAGLQSVASASVTVTLREAAPTASLIVTPSNGPPPLEVTADASGSFDRDATPIATYAFDFGDGTPVVGPAESSTAQHVYATEGDYTVTVVVADTGGLSSAASAPVTVSAASPDFPPTAVLALYPTSGTAPLLIYADASGSTDVDASPIASYSFDFGDGTPPEVPGAGPSASHTFLHPGTYVVTVTVRNTSGLASTAGAPVQVFEAIDAPPVARLFVYPPAGVSPLSVTAYAGGSYDFDATPIASFTFDFGDGTMPVDKGLESFAYHVYPTPGLFTISVTVTDTAGLASTASAQVLVQGPLELPPVARLSVVPSSGTAPLTVTADASGSTDSDATPIASFRFDFGDGSAPVGPSTNPSAQHVYSAAGTYVVGVIVTDTGGLSSSDFRLVQVSPHSLIGNTGFELDAAGWKANGAGALLERVVGGHSGAWSARMTNTGPSPATCGLNDSPNWIGQTAPGSYRGHLWVRADAPGARLKLRFREFGGGMVVASKAVAVSLGTGWQPVILDYVPAAPGLTSLDYNALVDDAPPGTCFYADDASIEFSSGAIAGNAPPIAALTVDPSSGPAPLLVTMDASASVDQDARPIGSYLFLFGDGTPPAGPQPGAIASHTYALPGSYEVTMIVTDTAGLASTATAVVEATVPVVGQPPRAALTVTPASGTFPLTVNADASASIDPDGGPIAGYRFDFGDGTPPVGPQADPVAQHTYAAAGAYTVTVTVNDTAGMTASAAAGVTVNPPGEIAGNPGFEADASGWKTTTDSITLQRIRSGRSGNWAARLTNAGTQNAPCGLNDSPNWVGLTATGSYLSSLWARAETPGDILKLLIREYRAGELVGSQSSTISLTTAWQGLSVSYVPVAPGVSTLDFKAYISSARPGACFDADDISITLK